VDSAHVFPRRHLRDSVRIRVSISLSGDLDPFQDPRREITPIHKTLSTKFPREKTIESRIETTRSFQVTDVSSIRKKDEL